MSRYTNEDQKRLEQLIEEGWLDRLKARGAEALGGAKGVGQQVKGIGKALKGAYNRDDSMIKTGIEDVRKSRSYGHDSKIDYLRKNIDKRIDDFVTDIKNDISKLGLDIGNIEMTSGINDALNALKSAVDDVGMEPSQSLPDQSTPPPLPQQSDDMPEDEPENPTEYSFSDIVNKRRERGKQSALKRKSNPNPKKGKVRKDPLAKYAAPEQEEDLDDLFWK